MTATIAAACLAWVLSSAAEVHECMADAGLPRYTPPLTSATRAWRTPITWPPIWPALGHGWPKDAKCLEGFRGRPSKRHLTEGGFDMVSTFEIAKKNLTTARSAILAAGNFLREQAAKLSEAEFQAELKSAKISPRAANKAIRRATPAKPNKATQSPKKATEASKGAEAPKATPAGATPKAKAKPAKAAA
jgi:hypothetical protein